MAMGAFKEVMVIKEDVLEAIKTLELMGKSGVCVCVSVCTIICIHTHSQYIFTFIYICMCVCVCV